MVEKFLNLRKTYNSTRSSTKPKCKRHEENYNEKPGHHIT